MVINILMKQTAMVENILIGKMYLKATLVIKDTNNTRTHRTIT